MVFTSLKTKKTQMTKLRMKTNQMLTQAQLQVQTRELLVLVHSLPEFPQQSHRDVHNDS